MHDHVREAEQRHTRPGADGRGRRKTVQVASDHDERRGDGGMGAGERVVGLETTLAAGVMHTGATVHLVDSGMDTGRVLAQVVEEVRADDSVDTLHERIKVKERQLIVEVIRQQLANHE